jgi:uncharacterized membrane protein
MSAWQRGLTLVTEADWVMLAAFWLGAWMGRYSPYRKGGLLYACLIVSFIFIFFAEALK